MAWMSDEQYEFFQDCKEKKITARSARNVRTHCGKGGAVKFPSDYMTKKEREAMNGKCVSYRMNSPITWEEFKTWPEEHQETYIKLLRKKYGVPDAYIAEMMGVSRPQFCKFIVSIGLGRGKSAGGTLRIGKWDKDGFYAWCGGVKASNAPIEVPLVEIRDDVEVVTPETENKLHDLVNSELMTANQELSKSVDDACNVNIPEEDADHLLEELENEINEAYDNTLGNYKPIEDAIHECSCESKTVIPERGEMTLQGNVDDILRTISKLLDGRQVRLEVEWEVFG